MTRWCFLNCMSWRGGTSAVSDQLANAYSNLIDATGVAAEPSAVAVGAVSAPE